MQSYFMERAGTQEQREQLVKKIGERQRAIEVDNQAYPPLSIFAEGTTTNGTRLIPFKRGAFSAMRTVTPSWFTVTTGQIWTTYEIVEMLPL